MAKIGFFGAARQVTGSKHLLTLADGRRILLDCGLFQGEGRNTEPWNRHFGFDPYSLDAVILSHAHIDHSGLLPRLIRQGYKGPIYCTPATLDLVQVMLMDSAEIQEEDFEHLKRHHREKGHEPLYTIDDTKQTFKQLQPVPYSTHREILPGVELMFTDAGHILGSAVVNLTLQEGGKTLRVAFTGDLGRYNSRILRDPMPFPQADYLITESTYGDRLHRSRDEGEQVLKQAILETCGLKKGKLLLPAFSLGRTQDMLYMLNRMYLDKEVPQVPVYVDSPLAEEVTEVVRQNDECYDDETRAFMKRDPEPFDFPELRFTRNVKDSIKLNDVHKPCIIIASSGMLEAGRIRHHLVHNISDARNTLLLTAYAPPESLGGQLKRGDRRVEIWDQVFEVKADVISIDGFSAHGDRDEMLRVLECQHPAELKGVFLVHGEYEVQLAYKETLQAKGYKNITIPGKGEEIELV